MDNHPYSFHADILKALAHPTRLQILELLKEGEKCVCEIVPQLQMEQSNVSRHLNVLKKEGLVNSRKEGLKVFYQVSDVRVFQIMETCSGLLKDMWESKRRLLA